MKIGVVTTQYASNYGALAKSAMVLTLVNAFSIVFSFVMEAVFAVYYGTSYQADAYTVAVSLPVTLFAVINVAIQTVIIPLYSKLYYKESKKSADSFISDFLTVLCIFTAIVVVIFEVFTDAVVYAFSPGLNSQTHKLAVELTRIIVPTIVFSQIINVNNGVLNSNKSFALPALTSNIQNVIFVLAVISLHNKFGIFAAIFGNFAGIFLSLLYSIAIRRKYYKYKFRFSLSDPSLKSAVGMTGPVFLGIGAAEINKLIDGMIASFLVTGSIASLNYASKLTSAVSTLLISGVSTVIYPQMARQAAKDDNEGMAETLNLAISFFILILFPLILGGYVLRNEIISIVFMRGAFDEESVSSIAPLFVCYMVCLFFTALRQASSRLFYSLEDSKTPMYNSLIGIGINIVLNLILAKFLGALGLALATTVSTAVIAFLILKTAKKRLSGLKYKKSFILGVKSGTSAGLMLAVLMILKNPLQKIGFFGAGIKGTFLYTLIMVLIGAAVYLAGLLIFKTSEIKIILSMIRGRKKK